MDLKEILIPVRHEVQLLEKTIQDNLTSRVPFVESVVSYVIANGGKRLRPILTILASKLSGYQGEASVSIGAAIEFMHTASLLHDDVLDNARLRRGRDSINKKWGNHVCVLVGDFFYCRAMDILVRHGDIRILRSITDAVTTTTEGEILEITKSNNPATSEDDYLQIIGGKTAALISAACESGAILGQVSDDYQQALKRFGFNIGMAFQLMDDVLDYTSTEEEFGKVSGTDLKEGKMTLPLILALKRCSEKETQLVKNALITGELEPQSFKEVLDIVERHDGIRDTTKLAKNYLEKARENLAPFRPSIEKDTLYAIAEYVIGRRH